jgi:hypothetical protein
METVDQASSGFTAQVQANLVIQSCQAKGLPGIRANQINKPFGNSEVRTPRMATGKSAHIQLKCHRNACPG